MDEQGIQLLIRKLDELKSDFKSEIRELKEWFKGLNDRFENQTTLCATVRIENEKRFGNLEKDQSSSTVKVNTVWDLLGKAVIALILIFLGALAVKSGLK